MKLTLIYFLITNCFECLIYLAKHEYDAKALKLKSDASQIVLKLITVKKGL